jgi:FkbM family methyltransferase
VKALVQRAIERAGYRVYRERPRDLANPLPAELAAHRALLRAVLEHRAVTTVLDVGAHTGGYGALLRSLGYTGEIVSFEPVAASFAVLSSRLDDRWHAHRLALGRSAGRLALNVAHESNFTSFLAPIAVQRFAGSATARVEEVEVQRLDAVASGERILLKTDTQGFDLEVIEGARGILGSVVALQVELSVTPLYDGAPGWLDVLRELRDLGFAAASLTGVGRAEGLRALEFDCLLVRG